MEQIILASASPRREYFFRLLGLPFTVIPAKINETPALGLTPIQIARDLALKKVRAVIKKTDCKWVFGADTIITLNGKIYGKPADEYAAREMLESLAGKVHEAITAMALWHKDSPQADVRHVCASVEMAKLDKADIEWYISTGEWQGAAGAYRLQEKGGCIINSINGCPSTVAGLPLREFYLMLKDNGYRFDLC